MKNKYLFIPILVALFAAIAGSPSLQAQDIAIDETNFPDANFRSFLLQQPYGLDGTLSPADIQSIHELDIREKQIASLVGIEHFAQLKVLTCSNNALEQIDLSQNTALGALFCISNRLSALDLAALPQLKVLYCSGNRLTELNLAGNPGLVELDCVHNELTALDVSPLTQLEVLYCSTNKIAALDLSANKTLGVLSCARNQLTTLELSSNTELTQLICNQNKIDVLDLSKNSQLVVLWFYKNRLDQSFLDHLFSTLPDHKNSGAETKLLAKIDDPNAPTEEGENNGCTKAQAAAAKAKGWKVYKSIMNEGRLTLVEYDGEGSDPAALDGVAATPLREVARFAIDGTPTSPEGEGTQIVVYSDGSTRKISRGL